MSDTTQLKFRGTKGNWGNYMGGDNYSIDIVLPNVTTISLDRHERNTGVLVADRDEMTANAHLIAAAPDLLAAAIRMVDACCGDQRDEYELQKGLGTPVYTAMLQLTAAINKALNYE